MSVQRSPGLKQLLGVEDGSELLARAAARWPCWVRLDGRLAVVGGSEELLTFVAQVPAEQADRCLLALAMLAAPDGADDPAAAGLLAKALMPGAIVLASRLTSHLSRRRWDHGGGVDRRLVSARVDEAVASQLWIEVRSFPWKRLTKVGGNILMNTRARVLLEFDDAGQLYRTDRTWSSTSRVADWALEQPLSVLAGESEPPDEDLRGTLVDVLEWACGEDVISASDRELLLSLVDAARTNVPLRETTRGKGNLCSAVLAAAVAPQFGVSASTVRRRASAAVDALAAATPARYVPCG